MVTLNSIFYNLIIKEALEKCPSSKVGRPRALSNECALTEFFKILRTGMQWREVTVKSHCTTLLRRMHLWTEECVQGCFPDSRIFQPGFCGAIGWFRLVRVFS